MHIPNVIRERYGDDQELAGFVNEAVSGISSHISSNKMVFFPEYTDHDVSHLSAVLGTASSLATDDSLEIMSPEDAAVLAVAVALHDLGMHLTRDGFETLVDRHNDLMIGGIDTIPWSSLWETFLGEASRFDGRRLRALFGEHYKPARVPPGRGQDWEDRDYLLVGEFLRRNHPRLAHDIALFGMPAKDGTRREMCGLASERRRVLADLCGLVARSHGHDIRYCLKYVAEKYENTVDPRRVRVAYLMVLLRISDYLQIQAERAPSARTDVSKLKSPISNNEWKVHQSIKDIRNTGSDPEAILITAYPPDAESYVRLVGWLRDLQAELDTSWAVIGEVFGLQKGILSKLGLRVRRIKSNTDDAAKFANKVDYVPQKVSFEAANADLLKLLVGPLYENDESVGLRELIQNAVDAVKERRHLAAREGNPIDSSIGVSLHLDVENGEVAAVTIRDAGVGMSLDVLTNYFFKVGASFRRSDKWRLDFEDDAGQSKIVRSGRFGVGVLAAFLLGDEIEVVTRRHGLSEPGYRFTAHIDDDVINVAKEDAAVGTTVRITVPKHIKTIRALNKFNKIEDYNNPLGHYFGNEVPVERSIGSEVLVVSPSLYLPSEAGSAPFPWRSTSSGAVTLHWTYDRSPDFACNGIIVKGSTYGPGSVATLPRPLMCPHISAVDPNGDLNINLQRNSANLNAYVAELTKSVLIDLLSYAVLTAPEEPDAEWCYGSYSGFAVRGWAPGDQTRWALTSGGYILAEKGILSEAVKGHAIIGIGGRRGFDGWGRSVLPHLGAGDAAFAQEPHAFYGGGNRRKGVILDALKYMAIIGINRVPSNTVIIPDSVIEIAESNSPGKELRRYLGYLRASGVDGWKVYGPDDDVLLTLVGALDPDFVMRSPIMFSRGAIVQGAEKNEEAVSKPWFDTFGSYQVPYRLSDREPLRDILRELAPATFACQEQFQAASRSTAEVGAFDESGGSATESEEWQVSHVEKTDSLGTSHTPD